VQRRVGVDGSPGVVAHRQVDQHDRQPGDLVVVELTANALACHGRLDGGPARPAQRTGRVGPGGLDQFDEAPVGPLGGPAHARPGQPLDRREPAPQRRAGRQGHVPVDHGGGRHRAGARVVLDALRRAAPRRLAQI
jgi:hypothetical protein